ncbi:MAG: hypothetical protein H7836_03860 [Magnetococcus sp. YQC-3]
MERFSAPLLAQIHWTTDRGEPTPADFGDPTGEYTCLMEKAAWVDFSHQGKVALTGRECVDFFAGLTTNQVRHVSTARSLYSALLTPQGRYLWDFTLLADGGAEEQPGLLLISEPDRIAELVQQIAFYRLRAKIQITDRSRDFILLGLVGPEADLAIQQIFPDLPLTESTAGATFAPATGARLWRDPRHGAFGWRLLIPVAQWITMREQLLAARPLAGFTAWESCRIQHALPRGGNELIPNETLPLEAGLWEMNGVDFAKGCYLGQETTARTHHRATLKKSLFQVVGAPGSTWAPGTDVVRADGKESGKITSHCPRTGTALALLRSEDVVQHQPLSVQGAPVTINKPSWAR